MKPVLSIQDLVKVKTFGTNILITESIAKLEESYIKNYHTDSRKATFRIVRESPSKEGSEQNNIIFFARTNQKENKEFFEKLDHAAFHIHGDIDSDKLKEELLPLYSAHVEETLGYGTDAELVKVSHKSGSRKSAVFFKTTKTYKKYDEFGKVTEEQHVKEHQATWAFLDPAVDYPNIVVIPRNLFSNTIEFLRLFCKAVGIDTSRVHLSQNPTIPGTEKVEVHFNATDLVYSGSLPVTILTHGDAVTIYDKKTGAPVTPETGEDGGGDEGTEPDPTDPVDPPETGGGETGGGETGGTGEGKDPEGNEPDPEPVILQPSLLSYIVDGMSRKIVLNVEYTSAVKFTHNGVEYNAIVVDNAAVVELDRNSNISEGDVIGLTLEPTDPKAETVVVQVTMQNGETINAIPRNIPKLEDYVVDAQRRELTVFTEHTKTVSFTHAGKDFIADSDDNAFVFKFGDSESLPEGTVLSLTLVPTDTTESNVTETITVLEGDVINVRLIPELVGYSVWQDTNYLVLNTRNAEAYKVEVNGLTFNGNITDNSSIIILPNDVSFPAGTVFTVTLTANTTGEADVVATITLTQEEELISSVPALVKCEVWVETRDVVLTVKNTTRIKLEAGGLSLEQSVSEGSPVFAIPEDVSLLTGSELKITLYPVDASLSNVIVTYTVSAEEEILAVPKPIVINNLTYSVDTKTVSVEVDNSAQIEIFLNDVSVAVVEVTDKPITHMLTVEVNDGDVIKVVAGTEQSSITVSGSVVEQEPPVE